MPRYYLTGIRPYWDGFSFAELPGPRGGDEFESKPRYYLTEIRPYWDGFSFAELPGPRGGDEFESKPRYLIKSVLKWDVFYNHLLSLLGEDKNNQVKL